MFVSSFEIVDADRQVASGEGLTAKTQSKIKTLYEVAIIPECLIWVTPCQ